MGDPARGFFLYVGQKQVPKYFSTREDAEAEAVPHQSSLVALQIQTTSGLVHTWNYAYDLNRWVERIN